MIFTSILMPALMFAAAATTKAPVADPGEWRAYGRDEGGSRYSPLSVINRSNVTKLKVAWTYRTGALDTESRLNNKAAFECTPLMVNGKLYIITPFNRVIALDPETGKELWHHDPDVDRNQYFNEVTSRGVSYWSFSAASSTKPCSRRIFFGTLDARLIALDADTGKRCSEFGSNGEVDLKQGIHIGPDKGQYQLTSPPAIVGDIVITGSSIGDNRRVDQERGIVRGYNARTGALLWTFDPLQPGTHYGGGNAWGVIAADSARDLVFVPTGSASPDFYGGERLGDNRYANSIVALRARTGRVVWHFQLVHHDVWDYDIAAQPSLMTVKRGDKLIPAVAAMTKTAFLYLFDRETGKPLLPIEERPTPQTDVEGEKTWPTQPFTAYAPLAPQGLRPEDAWGLNAGEREGCRKLIASMRADGMFAPPSIGGTVQLPGQIGGVSWGGAAVDPSRGWVIVNTTRLAMKIQLTPARSTRACPLTTRVAALTSCRRRARHTRYFAMCSSHSSGCRATLLPGARSLRSISQRAASYGRSRLAKP
jgi:quinoprotein glucose dehydrogenase